MSQGILLIEIVGSLQLRMQAGGVAGLGKWVIGIGNRNDPDGTNLNALQTRAVYMHQTPNANPMIVASRQRSETSERPHHRLCALHRPATWPRRDDRSVDRCGEAGKLDRGESRIDGEDLTDCWNSYADCVTTAQDHEM